MVTSPVPLQVGKLQPVKVSWLFQLPKAAYFSLVNHLPQIFPFQWSDREVFNSSWGTKAFSALVAVYCKSCLLLIWAVEGERANMVIDTCVIFPPPSQQKLVSFLLAWFYFLILVGNSWVDKKSTGRIQSLHLLVSATQGINEDKNLWNVGGFLLSFTLNCLNKLMVCRKLVNENDNSPLFLLLSWFQAEALPHITYLSRKCRSEQQSKELGNSFCWMWVWLFPLLLYALYSSSS